MPRTVDQTRGTTDQHETRELPSPQPAVSAADESSLREVDWANIEVLVQINASLARNRSTT